MNIQAVLTGSIQGGDTLEVGTVGIANIARRAMELPLWGVTVLGSSTDTRSFVLASSSSQLNIPPRGTCCTTTRLDNTSATYILNIPLFTLRQPCTPTAMEYSCGECSWNGPLFSW